MKIKEINDKDTQQLRHDLVERTRHLFDLRTQSVTEKLEAELTVSVACPGHRTWRYCEA